MCNHDLPDFVGGYDYEGESFVVTVVPAPAPRKTAQDLADLVERTRKMTGTGERMDPKQARESAVDMYANQIVELAGSFISEDPDRVLHDLAGMLFVLSAAASAYGSDLPALIDRATHSFEFAEAIAAELGL